MSEASPKKRWGTEQRLEFIDFTAYWQGSINRSHIVDHFGVSAQQASNDLTEYQKGAPENLRYDLSSKRYLATESFHCAFIKPDAERYLAQLGALTANTVDKEETWLGDAPVTATLPIPARRVDAPLLRAVLKAIRTNQSVEIEYQSLSSAGPTAVWRRITPHAFASDGFRWHMRAFCHRDNRFKDFLLSRCRGARDEQASGADAADDKLWHTNFAVELVPNPRLTEWEQKAIELDYGMFNGRVVLQVRMAMLYYFDKRMRNEFALRGPITLTDDPKQTPVVIANLEEYEKAKASVGA
ncbi:WYL domain-containing protein [Burkholderia cepacia]|uniref:WYL domain-containing protein n=1 Tax=Burkholderia cepacia TaxID=292 RepID=UPI002AB7F13C|nr:WYL domain-containing protein [Burkholderia cepacia]